MADHLDVRALFRALAANNVDYIVVGAFAVHAHGFVRTTADLDIVPRPDLANLSRLGEVLGSIGARLWKTSARVNVTDPHKLRRAGLVPLVTDHGRLDILNVASTAGLSGDYDELRGRALEIDFEGTPLAIIGLDDLIRMKRAAGREQDIADIRALAALDEDLAREAGEAT
jgi:hypothetical protein